MKFLQLLVVLSIFSWVNGQKDESISTIDFVQIIDGNKAEAVHYFENNWKILRKMATKRGYIKSFEVMDTPFSEDAPFHLVFLTTYANRQQYSSREKNFAKLIEEKGGLDLKNEKRPDEFRKTIYSKEEVRHWQD